MKQRSKSVDLPRDVDLSSVEGISLLNERLRSLSGPAVGAVGSRQASGATSLVFSAPWVLSTDSMVAPLLEVASPVRVSEIVAMLKQPPTGGQIRAVVMAGDAELGSIIIPAGSRYVRQQASISVPARSVLSLELTSVGLTFPGADLTVILR